METEEGLEIWYATLSFYSQKVRLYVHEKGIHYKHHPINLEALEQYDPDYVRNVNKECLVPVAKIKGHIIADSNVIISALEETYNDGYPTLIPSGDTDEGRKVKYFWTKLDSIRIELISYGSVVGRQCVTNMELPEQMRKEDIGTVLMTGRLNKLKQLANASPELGEFYTKRGDWIQSFLKEFTNETKVNSEFKKLEGVLDEVETQMQGGTDWLTGATISIADVVLAITLKRMVFIGRKSWGDGRRPNITAYYDRLLQRKQFQDVCLVKMSDKHE